jgi:hypothetical protein
MRIPAFAILAIGTISIGSAAAQTYDPAYPVCLRVHAHYYECRYTSLPQCNASASGRAAQCFINHILPARKCPRVVGGVVAPTKARLLKGLKRRSGAPAKELGTAGNFPFLKCRS